MKRWVFFFVFRGCRMSKIPARYPVVASQPGYCAPHGKDEDHPQHNGAEKRSRILHMNVIKTVLKTANLSLDDLVALL